MPKAKKGRKAQKRDRSPSPAVSEQSTDSVAQATIEVEVSEQPATKEPEGADAEAAEPQVSQEGIGDTPIPSTQPDQMKKRIKIASVILSDEDEARIVKSLADHPLMYNKKIKEYK